MLLAASCSSADSAAPAFRPVGQVERIVVTMNFGRDTLPPITDSARIRSITAFVDAHADGWMIPWAGVPVARVNAGFYRGASDRGAVHYFGANTGAFVASSRPDDFASQRATDADIAEFLRLVGSPADAVPAR